MKCLLIRLNFPNICVTRFRKLSSSPSHCIESRLRAYGRQERVIWAYLRRKWFFISKAMQRFRPREPLKSPFLRGETANNCCYCAISLRGVSCSVRNWFYSIVKKAALSPLTFGCVKCDFGYVILILDNKLALSERLVCRGGAYCLGFVINISLWIFHDPVSNFPANVYMCGAWRFSGFFVREIEQIPTYRRRFCPSIASEFGATLGFLVSNRLKISARQHSEWIFAGIKHASINSRTVAIKIRTPETVFDKPGERLRCREGAMTWMKLLTFVHFLLSPSRSALHVGGFIRKYQAK